MAFKVNEQHGVWAVTRDSNNLTFGGLPISYAEYKELKSAPHNAVDRFHRDDSGILRKRVTSKTIKP